MSVVVETKASDKEKNKEVAKKKSPTVRRKLRANTWKRAIRKQDDGVPEKVRKKKRVILVLVARKIPTLGVKIQAL